MTRFARAKGSKASNERLPEEATPWGEMKKQLLEQNAEHVENKKRKEAFDQRNLNYKTFLEEKEQQELDESKWAEFPSTNAVQKGTNKKKTSSISKDMNERKLANSFKEQNSATKKEKNKLRKTIRNLAVNETIDLTGNDSSTKNTDKTKKAKTEKFDKSENIVLLKKNKFKTAIKIDLTNDTSDIVTVHNIVSEKNGHKTVKTKKGESNKSKEIIVSDVNNSLGDSNPPVKESKHKLKKTAGNSIQSETTSIKNTNKVKKRKLSEADELLGQAKPHKIKKKNNVLTVSGKLGNLTEETVKKIEKKKQKKLKQLQKKKQFKEIKKAQNEQQLQVSKPNPSSTSNSSDNQTFNNNNNRTFNKNDNSKFNNSNTNPKIDKSAKTIKKKFKNKDELHRRKPFSEKMFINGKEIDIAYVDGFPVKKEDADRLKKLKKEMISKGLPRSEIKIAMKLERRRAEKAFAREKKKVCFNCRKSGHNLSECPELGKNELAETAGSGICFKCGSTEHTHFQCKVVKGQEYKFAQCFICNEQGHIARQCPDNARGLYPKGGACKVCGDVTHLKKDCPQYQAQQKHIEDSLSIETLGNDNPDSMGEDTNLGKSFQERKPNKIKFS